MQPKQSYTLNFDNPEGAEYAYLLVQRLYGLHPMEIIETTINPLIIFSLRALDQTELQRLIEATQPVSFTVTDDLQKCVDCGAEQSKMLFCACCLDSICCECLIDANEAVSFIIDGEMEWDVRALCCGCRAAIENYPYGPQGPREELAVTWMNLQEAKENPEAQICDGTHTCRCTKCLIARDEAEWKHPRFRPEVHHG